MTRIEAKIHSLMMDLFNARCLDLGIDIVNAKLQDNFLASIDNIFKGALMDLKGLGIGNEACKVVATLIAKYKYEVQQQDGSEKVLPFSKLNLANN